MAWRSRPWSRRSGITVSGGAADTCAGPAGVVFHDSFECPPNTAPNTFAAWDSTGGTPIISNAFAYSGVYSCQINAAAEEVSKNLAAADTYYGRCYVYFDALSQANGNYLRFLAVDHAASGHGPFAEVFHDGTNSKFSLFDAVSSGRTVTDVPVLTGQWYCVEVKFQKGVGAGNGFYLWIDNVQKAGPTINGDDQQGDRLRVGWSIVGGSATYYVDCVVADDAPIGL